jgi:hypothetical protein
LTGKSFSTSIDVVASEQGFYNIAGSAELDVIMKARLDRAKELHEAMKNL